MPLRGHKFKTSKEDKKSDLLRFFAAFLAFALVFGSISAVVILRHNDISIKSIFSKNTTAPEEDTTDATDTTAAPLQLQGKTNFLIYCYASDYSETFFIHIVRADMDNRVLKVQPLDPDGKTADGKTYAQILEQDGGEGLLAQIEQKEGIEIAKYIGSTDENFASAINYMGGLEYNAPERIEYRSSDYTLILTKGAQTIKGETLLKYFRYCKTLGADGLRTQGLLVCEMLESYINEKNIGNGTIIYRKLLSLIKSESNISFFETAEAMATVKAYCMAEDRQKPSIIMNSSEG